MKKCNGCKAKYFAVKRTKFEKICPFCGSRLIKDFSVPPADRVFDYVIGAAKQRADPCQFKECEVCGCDCEAEWHRSLIQAAQSKLKISLSADEVEMVLKKIKEVVK